MNSAFPCARGCSIGYPQSSEMSSSSPELERPPHQLAGSSCNLVSCWLALLVLVSACAGSPTTNSTASVAGTPREHPLSDATILIIRHAEKPPSGPGLSAEGQARAEAYVRHFQKLRQGSQRLTPDYIAAADDSDHSQRSRLTVEPLAQALGSKPDLR